MRDFDHARALHIKTHNQKRDSLAIAQAEPGGLLPSEEDGIFTIRSEARRKTIETV
jgi:hypothetical protein